MSIATTYYALTLGDNSVKVIRFDNNKAVVCKQGLDVKQICEDKDSDVKICITDAGTQFINPIGPQLQIFDLASNDLITMVEVKQRNHTNEGMRVASFDTTEDSLVTVE